MMKSKIDSRELEYGSENVNDATALVRGVTAEASQPVEFSSRTNAPRNRLVVLGLALCLAGATLTYRSSSAVAAGLAAVPQGLADAVGTMNLASDQIAPTTTTPTPTAPAVESGRAFLLKAMTKTNLCVDDGGGTTADKTTLTMQLCDLTNSNQAFIYNNTTSQIKSKSKKNLCIQAGVGGDDMKLKTCDPKNGRQKFTYDASSQIIRNPASNLCFSDRDLDVVGTGFTTWSCGMVRDEGKFGFKYTDTPFTETPAVSAAVARGEFFMVRRLSDPGSCLTEVDGGYLPSFSFAGCNQDDKKQYFTWNAAMKRMPRGNMFYSDCMEAAWLGLTSYFAPFPCDANNDRQDVQYDQTTMQLRTGSDCLDSKLNVQPCNPFDLAQLFERVLRPPLPVLNVVPVLRLGKPFQLKLVGTINNCVVWYKARDSSLWVGSCDAGTPTMFLYDAATYLLSNQNSENTCIEAGGIETILPRSCEPDSRAKYIVYDEGPQLIRNPHTNKCLSVKDDRVVFTPCGDISNRRFKIVPK